MVDETVDGKQFCFFGIFGDNTNMVILGDAFLRAYYSIYDFEESRVGIALHKYSLSYLEKKFPVWIIVLSVFAVLIVLFAIGCILLRRYKKKQRARKMFGGTASSNPYRNLYGRGNNGRSGASHMSDSEGEDGDIYAAEEKRQRLLNQREHSYDYTQRQ